MEGGLYRIITRGDRRDRYCSPEDHYKFLTLLAAQKEKLSFLLYAFCLMTHYVHLPIERRGHVVGR